MLFCVVKLVDGKVEAASFGFFGGSRLGEQQGEFREFFNLIAANRRNFHKSEKLKCCETYTFLETVLTLQGTFSCYFSPDPPSGCM